MSRALGNERGVATSIKSLGDLALAQEDYERAARLGDESLALVRKLGNEAAIATTLLTRGFVALVQGHQQEATGMIAESLRIRLRLRENEAIPNCLGVVATLLAARGDTEGAARLLAGAGALFERVGNPLEPFERRIYDQNVGRIKAQLSEETFALAWAEGRAMSFEQAVAFALEATAEPPRISSAAPGPSRSGG